MTVTTRQGFSGLRWLASGLLAFVCLGAQAEGNWYVGFEYNRVFVDDADGEIIDPGEAATSSFCIPGVPLPPPGGGTCGTDPSFQEFEITHDDDNGFGFSVGYDFKGLLRIDASLKQAKNRLDEVRTQTDRVPAQGDVKSYSLLTNMWFDFNRTGTVRPYVGLGIGAAQVELADDEDVTMMGQAGLGLNFHITDVVVLDLGARYFHTDKPEYENFTSEYHGQNVVLGVRFNFPGEETASAAPADTDGDGVIDARDRCPGTPPGTPVNAEGCADTDGDGVIDTRDLCPGTPPGTAVDANGCSDIDGDGISDRIDACPNSPEGQAVMTNGCAVDQSVVLDGVNFEFDSAKLTVNAQRLLDRVAQSLIDSPTFTVELQGHTDHIGTDAYNLILSQDRAKAVKAYLIGKGVEPERMVARGYGERQPIEDNSTDEGRTRNRRVEMKVLSEEGEPSQ